jgi:hypothetical protein
VSGTSSLTERTLRLLIVGALAPAFVFGVVTVAMAAVQRDTQNMLISAGAAAVFSGIGMWTWLSTRAKPNMWPSTVSIAGWVPAGFFVMMATGSGIEEELGWSETTFFVAVAVIAVGLALLGWLPARSAARMVLTDLSSEVVDSALDVTFTARGKDADRLTVTPESLDVVVRPASVRKVTHSVPLGDVTGVAVRTESDGGEYPLAGTSMRVPPGDVVVVDLREGQLVFAADDAHRVREFVEARVRRWANAAEG